jgi:lipid-binding SYLF domain-containing protein
MIRLRTVLLSLLLASPFTPALADEHDDSKYQDTIKAFRVAEKGANLFDNAYGYAVYPTIGKGAVVLGAAHGSGRVYVDGKHVGDTKVTQLTAGPQLGGQAYSQVIFFENKRAFDEFTRGEPLPRRHGGVHHRQRRIDARGEHRRPEVQLQGEVAAARRI